MPDTWYIWHTMYGNMWQLHYAIYGAYNVKYMAATICHIWPKSIIFARVVAH